MHTLDLCSLQPHSLMECWLVMLISLPASLQCSHSLSFIAELRPHSQLRVAAGYLDASLGRYSDEHSLPSLLLYTPLVEH